MMTADDEELIITPVPALVAVLLNLEHTKGSPLTESEVTTARDNAACIAMPRAAHAALAASRGYADIDPEHVWEAWLESRASSGDEDD